MTERQYWDGDCELVRFFRQADQIQRERKNQELWIQGMYIYEAIMDLSPILHAFAKKGTKPHPYRSKPYQLVPEIEKKATEQEIENERLKAELFFKNWARANRNAGR